MKDRSTLTLLSLFVVVSVLATLCLDRDAARAIPFDPITPTSESFLPFVVKQPPPTPTSCAPCLCTLNAQEQQIANLMINDPGQQRPSLTCHPILAQVARERAQDMADRNYFGHTNPEGYGPNYLVTQAGYILPSYYSTAPDANNIETIGGGYATAGEVWNEWTSSSTHRRHLLGEIPFFAEQIEYGIGYVRGGSYGHYWVVITARPGP